MPSDKDFSNRLREHARILADEARQFGENSTPARLCALGMKEDVFSVHDDAELAFFGTKFDISKKLFVQYDEQGRKTGDQQLNDMWIELFAALIFQYILRGMDQGSDRAQLLKYINILFKAFDKIDTPAFLAQERPHLDRVKEMLFALLPEKSLYEQAKMFCSEQGDQYQPTDVPVTLPIDVLFYEGPIARAYLEMLHALNLKPQRIIQLVSEKDLATGKPVGCLLPKGLRLKYAAALQQQRIHYWPKRLFKVHNATCLEIFNCLEDTFKIKKSSLMGLVKFKPLEAFSDNITQFAFNSLKDPRLIEFIKQDNKPLYLFTGGGIIPAAFFDLKNTKFLHIHPGYLPDIRGADCLLWSLLLSGHPSASSFYLDPGIDTGDIIYAAWLPKIKLPDSLTNLDNKSKYRLLYSFVDPWVRSFVLRETIYSTDYLKNVQASPQSIESGKTFYFMNQAIIENVIVRTLSGKD